MLGLLELLAIGYILFVGALIVYTSWVLTHPHRKTYAWAVARGRPGDPSELAGAGRAFSVWTFASGGRTFSVWDIPGDGAPGAPVVVLSHGWADSRLGGLARVPFLAPLASRLILWDLRGHGEAPGVCRLGTREVEDLLALVEAIGPPATPVVLYGWSLGAGVSIAAAARGAAVGVIAEAPYRVPIVPARNVMRGFRLPWRMNLRPAMWLLGTLFGVGPRWRGFDRAELAGRVRCPLLVIHGEDDAVCPVQDGRDIAAATPQGRIAVLAEGGHNDLWTEPAMAPVAAEAVEAFVAGLRPEAGARAGRLAP